MKGSAQITAPNELVLACRRLYSAIDKLDAKAASLVGVTRNDLRCLNLLAEAPQKPAQIITELGLTSGSVTALLDRLEKLELAKRSRDPNDRRSVVVHPTERLFEILGPLYRGVAEEITRISADYDSNERRLAVKHLSDACVAYEQATTQS
ncbi:MAG: MarR family transcriptional regulator [Pseudomonadota bacterium]